MGDPSVGISNKKAKKEVALISSLSPCRKASNLTSQNESFLTLCPAYCTVKERQQQNQLDFVVYY